MGVKIDMIGKTFGLLTVKEELPERRDYRKIVYRCVCECGNERDVLGENLRGGITTSCGCMANANRKLDIIGHKYNLLTVLEPTDRRCGHSVVHKCLCECGNIAYVSTTDLRTGNTKSCGCLKSKGESKISLLLYQHNIDFEKEYSVRINENYYRFDFCIKNTDGTIKYLIEYDGIQHFKTKTGGWNNENSLKDVKRRDNIKNEYCKNNNIPLIRIPYTHYNDITIEDLMLDSTNFLIKEGVE